ncbi:MAG: acyl-CoA carboxylase subunit epsilon [Stackebrandtia sp.]
MSEVLDVKVVAGAPTPEETAALCAVLAARARVEPADAHRPSRSPWQDPGRRLGARRSWRESALPR